MSGVRGFLIIITITSFVSSGVACAVVFNYHYDYEFCVYRVVCAVIFKLLLLPRFCFFFRVPCAVFFNHYCYCEFCVFRVACAVFIITTIASFVVRVVCAVIFNYYHFCDFVFVGWRARFFND